jgi:hypothetical protein
MVQELRRQETGSMVKCILYVGPVSIEVLEAAYAAKTQSEIRLCCSVGQVGPNAYTGLTLEKFDALVREFRMKYKASLFAERDHLGRDQPDDEWFKSDGPVWQQEKLESKYFDGVHLHSYDLDAAIAAVHVEPFKSSAEWQIGPGEDVSKPVHSLEKFDDAAKAWDGWVSAPFGPYIVGTQNEGRVNFDGIESYRRRFPRARLRCHACDYLPRRTLRAVMALCDGVNIAPQLGVAQSLWYLQHAKRYGRPINDWARASRFDTVQFGRWKLFNEEWYGCGHYHFDRIPWRDEVREQVVEHLAKFIEELADE